MSKEAKVWEDLRKYTQARVGLKRSGHAIGTHENLSFQLAHAHARDAIHAHWNLEDLKEKISEYGLPSHILKTKIQNRSEYLTRPDLGRLLDEESASFLKKQTKTDLLILVSNGLSSEAMHSHGFSYLRLLFEVLKKKNFEFAVYLVENARVALGDSVGDILKARMSLTLIGERPGLSSPDSMGLYLTYEPRLGRSDAERNCISNIREPHGLSYFEALNKTMYLVEESLRKGLSGVHLKDQSEEIKVLS